MINDKTPRTTEQLLTPVTRYLLAEQENEEFPAGDYVLVSDLEKVLEPFIQERLEDGHELISCEATLAIVDNKVVEDDIPEGWRIYSCDLSLASGSGYVMLIRNEEGHKRWRTMGDEERDEYPLFCTGSGMNFSSAFADACRVAKNCNQQEQENSQ